MTSVHAKAKWEDETKEANEGATAPAEGDADKKENDPHIGNTVASTANKATVAKPAPAAAKTTTVQTKQKKSLKRL